MDLEILKEEKNEIEVAFEDITIPEILRVYLNKDSSVDFVAWKQEHPTKKPILRVVTTRKTAKKAINDAIDSIIKELDNFAEDVKKL